jgi:hypothetical protein
MLMLSLPAGKQGSKEGRLKKHGQQALCEFRAADGREYKTNDYDLSLPFKFS